MTPSKAGRIPALLAAGAGLVLSGCVTLGGPELQTLAEQGRAEGEKQKVLAAQEARFQKIRRALVGRELKRGMPAAEIRRMAGDPVVVVSGGRGKEWGYASKHGNWFGGPEIFLFFDAKDALRGWECVPGDVCRDPRKKG